MILHTHLGFSRLTRYWSYRARSEIPEWTWNAVTPRGRALACSPHQRIWTAEGDPPSRRALLLCSICRYAIEVAQEEPAASGARCSFLAVPKQPLPDLIPTTELGDHAQGISVPLHSSQVKKTVCAHQMPAGGTKNHHAQSTTTAKGKPSIDRDLISLFEHLIHITCCCYANHITVACCSS